MKRIWSGATLADTTHFKNLLEHAGIDSFIKNVYIGSAVGELPVYESGPELWVFRDSDVARAETVLRDALRPPDAARTQAWRCPACGETIEGQFAACWSCGASDAAT
jgi:hypothetical protein